MGKRQIVILGIVLGLSLLGLIFTQATYFRTAFQLKKAQVDYMVNISLDEVISYIEHEDRLYAEKRQPLEPFKIKGKNKANISILQTLGDLNLLMNDDLFWLDEKSDENVKEFLGEEGNNSLRNSIRRSRQEVKERHVWGEDRIGKEAQRAVEERIKDIDLQRVIAVKLKKNGINSSFEFAVKEKDHFILMSKHFFNKRSDYSYNREMFFGESQSLATLFLLLPDQIHDTMSSIYLLLPSLIITILLVLCFGFCIAVIVRQKKLSAIKNDFINNMTHEFKTPIATISLAAQMLKDGGVKHSLETVDRIAGIIRDESKRLTFQVERVLQTALFTETRMKLKLKNMRLNEIVDNLSAKFRLLVEDKGGQLFCHLEATRDEAFADEVHLTNVLSNLLDNAIKYCIKVPEISVYTRNRGDEIIISVIDNGIGIARKDQKLIFERFYRVSTGNLHDVKGFGLGLSYVKTITEAHGGRIEVESVEGKGSRFDIILPLMAKKQKVKRTLFF